MDEEVEKIDASSWRKHAAFNALWVEKFNLNTVAWDVDGNAGASRGCETCRDWLDVIGEIDWPG